VTVTFAERRGKTEVSVRMRFESESLRDKVAEEFGAVEGLDQTLDRLEEHLAGGAGERSADGELVLTRMLDAPRGLVFEAWTTCEHLARWWGPRGFTNTIHEMDVRPGGVWRFVMHGPDGVDNQNKVVYLEIVRPELLVYDHVSGPRFHVTVTFAERRGKTEVSVRMRFESKSLRD